MLVDKALPVHFWCKFPAAIHTLATGSGVADGASGISDSSGGGGGRECVTAGGEAARRRRMQWAVTWQSRVLTD
jgi:hypothetical protein